MENSINIYRHKSNIGFLNKRINMSSVFLFIILALNLNFFYLLDSDKFDFSNISLILILVWILYELIKYRFKIDRKILKITLISLFFTVVLTITSSIQSNKLYGQPIWYGIRPQRFWVIYPLLFAPLAMENSNGNLTFESLKKTLKTFAWILIFISFVQFLLGDSVQLMHVLSNERYGNIRLYVDDTVVNICLFLACDDFNKRKKRSSNAIYIIAAVLFHLLITKSRMGILSIGVGLIFSFLVLQKLSKQKLLYICFAFFAFVVFLSSTVGEDILAMMNGTSTQDTSGIRELGRQFYIETIKKYPLFGGGFISTLWPAAFHGAKFDEYIYIVDNGIFGFMFVYGLLGIFFLIIFYLMLIKQSYRIYRKNKETFFLSLIACELSGMYTLMKMGTSSSVIIPLFILCLYMKSRELKLK